jgi:putative zinc finger/helix-turn-helix YgiT family protein
MVMKSLGPVCPVCGARAIVRTSDPVDVEIGGRTYYVEGVERERCTQCEEEFFFAGQSDELRARAAQLAREEQGLLSPQEIRQLRHDLGLTQSSLEAVIGVGEKTVGRWERGLYPQNKPADTLMRLLWSHPELLQETGFIAREGRGPYKKQAE